MTIKSHIVESILWMFFTCIVLVIAVVLYVSGDSLFGHCVLFMLFPIFLRGWIAVGRTIIMDKEGCTVRFLFFGKKYRWDELKTKRYVEYKEWYIGYRAPWQGGAEFSPNLVHKPKWLMPADYCEFIHPFSFFYVHFRFDGLEKIMEKTYFPLLYIVDEKEFREKLAEWEIEMDSM